ncbi:UNVERIFIED_CONTAM: hypothetical protein HDU68_000907 [Siphonaria sp. JEL0065]|nr:hypothetical protein HDU68_000907 [Siphonaria sp. JEL0065]
MAGKGFLNNRLTDEQGKEFFPRQFQKGVTQALPVLFDRLSGWNGDVDDKKLSPLLTHDLHEAFGNIHRIIHDSGYDLSFKYKSMMGSLDSSHSFPVVPDHVWLTFGTAKNVTSTLLRGPVVDRKHITVFTRKVTSPKNPGGALSNRRVFREICFEYVYEPQDLDGAEEDDSVVPDFQWKRNLMDIGQKVAVDSTVLGSMLSFQLTRLSDGVVVERGDVDLAGMGVRLESSHFCDDFPDNGAWKIADIDWYFISPRVIEEEKPPLLSV